MDTILTLATIAVGFFAFFWLLHLISLCYRWIVKKQKPTANDTFLSRSHGEPPTTSKKLICSLIVIATLSLFLCNNVTFRELVGIYTIEDLNSGTHCYYVEVSNRTVEYVLPGQISIHTDEVDENEYIRFYYIEKAYFPNGECLEFTDNYVTSLDEFAHAYDQNENEWNCKIINKHAYCPQIIETSYISMSTVVELLFSVLAVLYNWLGYIIWEYRPKNSATI